VHRRHGEPGGVRSDGSFGLAKRVRGQVGWRMVAYEGGDAARRVRPLVQRLSSSSWEVGSAGLLTLSMPS